MKQTITLTIPGQLVLLCQLLDTTPEEVLQAFINNVSLEVNSSGADERDMAVAYFMRVGYGMHRYDMEQVGGMFQDLDQLRYRQYDVTKPADKELRDGYLHEWFVSWQQERKER